jgi:competence protein ComEA
VRFVVLVGLLVVAWPLTARAGKGLTGVVNLNTAPPEVLGLLPGVGPAKAAEIAAYRKRRPFRTVDELVRIRGIGRKMVRRLREHLAVAGPTTASAVTGQPAVLVAPPAPVPAPARPLCSMPAPPTKRPPPVRWPSHAACLRPA